MSSITSLPTNLVVNTVQNAEEAIGAPNSTDIVNNQSRLANDAQEEKAIEKPARDAEPKEKEIDEAIAVLSEFMSRPPRNINFAKDTDSGLTVIKVFNSDNQELIRQFPSDELLSVAQKIKDLQQEVDVKSGILFDENI